MREDLSQQLKAWMQFFRDMGIGEFYRREASFEPESAKLESSQAEFSPAPSPGLAPPPDPIYGPVTSYAAPSPNPQVTVRQPGRSLTLFELNTDEKPGKPETLDEIREDLGECQRCKLWSGRKHIVFGQGNPRAELVFVGEGPGADEDEQGLPFVGRAGQLLNRILQLNGIRREEVYICNIIKCRPPGNRTPESDEIAACSPFLFRQIHAIQPRAVCCLGAPATRTVLGIKEGITKIHGRWFDYGDAKAIATVHPAYVLRNPREEILLRQDIEKIHAFLQLPR